jgi:hypothetical protein
VQLNFENKVAMSSYINDNPAISPFSQVAQNTQPGITNNQDNPDGEARLQQVLKDNPILNRGILSNDDAFRPDKKKLFEGLKSHVGDFTDANKDPSKRADALQKLADKANEIDKDSSLYRHSGSTPGDGFLDQKSEVDALRKYSEEPVPAQKQSQ